MLYISQEAAEASLTAPVRSPQYALVATGAAESHLLSADLATLKQLRDQMQAMQKESTAPGTRRLTRYLNR